MKALFRLLVLAGLAAALVALFTTKRGTDLRGSVSSTARSVAKMSGIPGLVAEADELSDDEVRARIDETRRRLQEELKATAPAAQAPAGA